MKTLQKGSANVWLVAVIVILLIIVGYLLFMKKPTAENRQVTSSPESTDTVSNTNNNTILGQQVFQTTSENQIIQTLLVNWKSTQAKFSSRAGEGGTFNPPSKIQFISAYTILVYYDDGLVDHISVVQFKNGSFVELKNVGVMSTMSQNQWQSLVSTYGNSSYTPSNYQSSDYKIFTKTSNNIFVR